MVEPVTVVEGRTLADGREADYHAWVQRMIAAMEHFPGNQGVLVLAPPPGQPGERYLVIRFCDESARQTWLRSTEWTSLREEAAAFLTPHLQTAVGAEAWFTLPGQPLREAPMWKMSLALVPSAYVVGTVAVLFARAALEDWPFLLIQLVITTLLCFVLTYAGLPITTRLLHRWLYPAASA